MKKKKTLSVIAYASAFLVFLGIMDYPFIARLVNERNVDGVITEYENNAKTVTEEKRRKQHQEAIAYNQKLASGTGGIKDAFYAGNADENYLRLLNMQNDGIMGIVKIPKLNLQLPIYHGTKEEVLQKGVGHVEGSSLPIGGTDTHACLSGHRGLPNKKIFTNLDEMEIGDLFFLEVERETLAYRVDQILTEEPDNTEPLKIESGKDMVTLITCTPYGINSHRMYVRGTRTTYDKQIKEEAENYKREWLKDYWWIPLNVILILGMSYTLYQYAKQQR